MNLLPTILFSIGLATATPLLAQTTPETIASETLKDLKTGNAKQVIDNLIAKAPLVSASEAEKTNLINTLNTFLSSYGRVEGWELILSKKASDRYAENSYMVFQEKYALHFEMKFYRGADGWVLTGFKFNDALDELTDAQFQGELSRSLAN